MSRAVPTFALALLALVLGLAPVGCGKGVEDQLAAARAQQDDGQFEESIEPLRAVLAEAPEHAEANYLLGYALVRTGRISQAIWPLRKAASSDEYATVASHLLSFSLLNSGNFDEARAVADALLARQSGEPGALRMRAQANIEGRRWEDVLADADQLLALDAADAQAKQLRAVALTELERWDDAEAAFQTMREEAVQAADPAIAGRACVAQARVRERRGAIPAAEETFTSCAESYPSDPIVLREVTDFYVRQEQPDKATAAWRTAAERAPDSLPIRLGLGRRLFESGQIDEAKRVVGQAAEDFASPQAWEALADLHRSSGDYAAAEEVLQKALQNADSERLRYKRADTLVDAGDLEAAEALAQEFQEPAFRDFIRGRVALLRGDPTTALEALEAGLVRWPDNAPARAAAGRAAQEIGDNDRAFEHYRQAIRADASATDAALAAALLARALGQKAEAIEFARYQVTSRPLSDERAAVLAAEVSYEMGNAELAVQFEKVLAQRAKDGDPRSAAGLARLVQERSGAEAAIAAVDASGLDLTLPENEPALRARVDAQVQQGHAAQALQAVDRALAGHPDAAALLDLRGRVLVVLDRNDEARAAFEQALAKDADYAPSHAALGALAVQAGDLDAALQHFDAAVAADPADVESAYRAATIVLARGDRAEGEKRLRTVLSRGPGHVGAANDLAWLLAEDQRDLDLALGLAQRAVDRAPSPAFIDTLAAVHIARDDASAAIEVLEPAVTANPDSGLLQYRLGVAREKLGDRDAALAAYREALEDGSFSEADQARAQIARLEAAGQ